MISQTPFIIKSHHRYELRSWIENNFPFIRKKYPDHYTPQEIKCLKKRASEIVNACNKVKDIDMGARSAYIEYYSNDWETINNAYNNKDYKALGGALNDLLSGINWE